MVSQMREADGDIGQKNEEREHSSSLEIKLQKVMSDLSILQSCVENGEWD